jgi:T-box protein 1
MRAELVEVDLWRQFHAQQNEMIITKAGRCLFPLFRVRFVPEEGMPLEEEREYRVSISIEPMDENKWKWRQGRWIPLLTSRLGMDETPEQIVCYERLKGSEMSFGGLNFDKIKLTNRDSDSPMTVCLQSFHRYIPTVQIVECDNPQRIQTLRFPETEFIAVTHYQNEQVTVLKKSYNPHAKGFVLSEGSPTQGTVDWLLTPAVTPESPKEQKRRRTRKRIRPITFDAIPSDEEELQGSIALQLLGSKDDD